MKKVEPAHLANQLSEFQKLSIKKQDIQPWEDGIRTDGKAGTYEWWYFDAHLDDGSSLVIVFFTKPMLNIKTGPKPYVMIEHVAANGTKFNETFEEPGELFSASTTACDVQIGKNYFRGNLEEYQIHYENKNHIIDVTLTGTVPSWRPETGYIYFGEDNSDYFAWLPAIPQGNVQAQIQTDKQIENYTGTGYHDHNWGNVPMMKLMNHWYWGRAKIGEYTVISSYITAEKKYGYQEFPVFMLAKDGKILADDSANYLSFKAEDVYIDQVTGKPVHQKLVYDYQSPDEHFRITYHRNKTLVNSLLADELPRGKAFLAKLIGFDGAYLRFIGSVTLEKFEQNKRVEKTTGEALWELMYFGKTQR